MLQQYMNHELPDVQAGLRKGRGSRDQIANIRWILEKARGFQKSINFCFMAYAKDFEATVRTRHGTTDWFKIGKRVRQDCTFSSCLFNLYAEYIK